MEHDKNLITAVQALRKEYGIDNKNEENLFGQKTKKALFEKLTTLREEKQKELERVKALRDAANKVRDGYKSPAVTEKKESTQEQQNYLNEINDIQARAEQNMLDTQITAANLNSKLKQLFNNNIQLVGIIEDFYSGEVNNHYTEQNRERIVR